MKQLRLASIYLAASLALMALALTAQPSNLGHIDFPTSGAPEAQRHFIQGVLLLHSFEYDDAREEFQAASRMDPTFAMAYWGEALTYTHPLWVQQDLASARAVLARLGPNPEARQAHAPTQREKDYLHTVEILYGEGDKVARDKAYAAAMGKLMDKYPFDLEAAALYSVALMGTCEGVRDYAVYMRAAAVAEDVFAKNPQHPGAIHYLIHAYDDPIHAPLGLRAARVYAQVAGAASHAQHMPSHIFFALGMWDDAIPANIESVKVADARRARKGLGPEARNYHSLYWLMYAHLQEGRVDDASRVLADVAKSQSNTGGNLALMRATYAIETGAWDKLPADLDVSKGGVVQLVAALTARGMVALRAGHTDVARKALADAKARITGGSSGPAHYTAGMPAGASPNDARSAEIMTRQLEALLLRADGKKDAGLKMLAETTAAEDALTFEFGPPTPVKPAHELYGEALLEDGHNKEARAEFGKALERAPKRALSLRGLANVPNTP